MPGGMTLVCANYVYLEAKKDGLTLMVGSGTTSFQGLTGMKGLKANYDEMPLILTAPSAGIYYTRPDACQKLEDFPKVVNELVFGCPPVPYSQTVSFMLNKKLFGWETKKDVLAYNSAADSRRALIGGEVDINGESVIGYTHGVAPLVDKGEIVPLWQSGFLTPEGEIVRQGGSAAKVPTVKEFYEMVFKKEPSGPVWDAVLAYIAYARVINKPLYLPPDTEEYATILREAAENMAKSAKFEQDAERMLAGAPLYTGAQAVRVRENAKDRAKISREWLQNWLHEGWGVEFK
jgi:hypothetical protein